MTTTRDISKLVTIVFLPRNTFDMTEKVLERIVECTPQSVPIIVTDTGAPPAERAWMENFCARNAHLLLRSKTYTTPPQIRNAALDHVRTKYVCFIDNDVLVTPGWLDALVNCAEETGAWVVGPLICERMPELTYVHGYDGDLEIRETEDGARVYHDFHYNAHVRLADIEKDLVRKPTPIVEFHLQLIAMKVFEDVGRYDEEIVNMYEYADLFLRFKTRDKIYLEPQSRVTYLPPRNIRRQDRWFFELRWSEAWTDLTEQKFAANHGLSARHRKPSHRTISFDRNACGARTGCERRADGSAGPPSASSKGVTSYQSRQSGTAGNIRSRLMARSNRLSWKSFAISLVSDVEIITRVRCRARQHAAVKRHRLFNS